MNARTHANTARIVINDRRRSAALLLRKAADAERAAITATNALQHAQVASWLAGHPAEMKPDLHAAWDAMTMADHRARTARRIAMLAMKHTPTGRRPLWGNASKTMIQAEALRRRTGQLWTARIGFLAATPKTRQPDRPAIFAQAGQ